jgi:hypothetical protein
VIPDAAMKIAAKAFGWCNGFAGRRHLDEALKALDEAGYIRTEPEPDNPVDTLRRSGL